MAYAYTRNTLIDYVVYYEYTVVNRSVNDYHDMRLALWNDADMGYYLDDLIEFDQPRRMSILYNGNNDDGVGAGHPVGSYGPNPPAMGVTIISMPGDAPGSYVPVNSFTYYNNDASAIGNPVIDTEYNNYMRGKARGGTDIPIKPNGWMECAAGSAPGDRRAIVATNDFTLNAGGKARLVLALVVDSAAKGCPETSLDGIRTVADTAWNFYHDATAIRSIATQYGDISVYPNPANDKLYVDIGSATGEAMVSICNTVGQVVYAGKYTAVMKDGMPIAHLAPGMYVVSFVAGIKSGRAVFVKQ